MHFRKKRNLLRRGIAAFLLFIMVGSSLAFAAEESDEQATDVTQDEEAVSLESLGEVDFKEDSDEDSDEDKIIDELDDSSSVILFGQEGTAKTVSLNWGQNINYENTAIHSFKVKCDGESLIAYCVEPTKRNLPRGSHEATAYDSPLIKKALYYSYGYPGYSVRTEEYLKGVSMKSVYKSKRGRIALCHMVLSYIFDDKDAGSDAFTGVCSATKKLVKNFTAAIEEWPDPPEEASVSLSEEELDAFWDFDEKRQMTPEITLSGTEGNTISVDVPEGTEMIKGKEKIDAGQVTVTAGESFSFSAPAEVRGRYESPVMEASMQSFQPYLIYSEEKQDLVFASTASSAVSFAIDWVEFGRVDLVKKSSDEGVTEGNTYYSLKGARYGLYSKATDIKRAELLTDQNGEASVENVPYGEYYLKELEPSQGYELDVAAHGISVASPAQSETVLEKPMIPDITTSAYLAGTGESTATEGGTLNISDKVKYSGVEPGLEYKIVGRLMDKSTGSEVKDTISEVVFTPDKSSGSLKMDYSMDSSGLGGSTVVAFERLYQGNNLIATHEDLNNEAQSVNIVKAKGNSPDTGDGINMLILAFAMAVSGLFGLTAIMKKN